MKHLLRFVIFQVTAIPLGLDAPSSIGMALLVIGPSFSAAVILLSESIVLA